MLIHGLTMQLTTQAPFHWRTWCPGFWAAGCTVSRQPAAFDLFKGGLCCRQQPCQSSCPSLGVVHPVTDHVGMKRSGHRSPIQNNSKRPPQGLHSRRWPINLWACITARLLLLPTPASSSPFHTYGPLSHFLNIQHTKLLTVGLWGKPAPNSGERGKAWACGFRARGIRRTILKKATLHKMSRIQTTRTHTQNHHPSSLCLGLHKINITAPSS